MNARPADSDTVMVPIPRAALMLVAPLPEAISPLNCEAIFGLDPTTFVNACKSEKWPARRVGRLWLARTEDVRAYLTSQPAPAPTVQEPEAPEDERERWAREAGFAPRKGAKNVAR